MRRVSSRTTEHIARRLGWHFPMWIGCGYPKSGTVWLCQLMSSYLGVPYPQNYALPIAMSSVVHAHWRYDPRLPPTAYIHRDGRDVMVSKYFYDMRSIAQPRHPAHARRLTDRFRGAFGRDFDPGAVRRNLPKFIELEMGNATGVHTSWPAHVRDWCLPERRNVTRISYESLLSDPEVELARLMRQLTGGDADMTRVTLAVNRFDFSSNAGRDPGNEDRSSFMRKGVAGDWAHHFTRESGEVFDAYAGDVLAELGYVDDHRWFESLPQS